MKTFEEFRTEYVVASNGVYPSAYDTWQACAAEYQPIIDEARKALAAWEHWYSVDSTEFNRDNAREQGRAVLDRSGARGGSVAGSPAPSLDNPPTNEGRSRT
jgi:hypothetical protein